MPYKLVYRANAIQNIRSAKSWYKLQRSGLQNHFAASLKETFIRLQVNPEAFAIRYRNVRVIHTNTFPFTIHFYIDKENKQIVITNILHDRRDFSK